MGPASSIARSGTQELVPTHLSGRRVHAKFPLERTDDSWVADEDHSHCMTCGEVQLSMGARHHCRKCGHLGCDGCMDFRWKSHTVCGDCVMLATDVGTDVLKYLTTSRVKWVECPKEDAASVWQPAVLMSDLGDAHWAVCTPRNSVARLSAQQCGSPPPDDWRLALSQFAKAYATLADSCSLIKRGAMPANTVLVVDDNSLAEEYFVDTLEMTESELYVILKPKHGTHADTLKFHVPDLVSMYSVSRKSVFTTVKHFDDSDIMDESTKCADEAKDESARVPQSTGDSVADISTADACDYTAPQSSEEKVPRKLTALEVLDSVHVQDLKDEIEEKKAHIARLQQVNFDLAAENETYLDESKAATATAANLTAQLAISEKRAYDLEQQLEEQRGNNETLKTTLETQFEEMTQLRTSVGGLESARETLAQANDALNEENAQLKLQLAAALQKAVESTKAIVSETDTSSSPTYDALHLQQPRAAEKEVEAAAAVVDADTGDVPQSDTKDDSSSSEFEADVAAVCLEVTETQGGETQVGGGSEEATKAGAGHWWDPSDDGDEDHAAATDVRTEKTASGTAKKTGSAKKQSRKRKRRKKRRR